jgi:hypothetical protein
VVNLLICHQRARGRVQAVPSASPFSCSQTTSSIMYVRRVLRWLFCRFIAPLCLATKSHCVDRLFAFADARPEFAKNPLARVETTGNGLNVCMLKALIVFGTC